MRQYEKQKPMQPHQPKQQGQPNSRHRQQKQPMQEKHLAKSPWRDAPSLEDPKLASNPGEEKKPGVTSRQEDQADQAKGTGQGDQVGRQMPEANETERQMPAEPKQTVAAPENHGCKQVQADARVRPRAG